MSFTKSRRAWASWGAVACVVAAVACGSSTSSQEPASGSGPVAEQTIGAMGGTVTSADGALTVAVPAGALGTDLKITVQEIAAPAPGSIGKTYEIGPTGTQFEMPVTLSFKYASSDLGSSAASDLAVATIVDSAWAPLAGDMVDTAAQIASGTTMHLSPYSLIAASHGAKKDAGGGTDASFDAPADATGDNDTGIVDAAADAADAADGASSCSAEVVAIGSCLNHPPFCTTFPGTHSTTCTQNDGGQGYVVMCCPNDGG